MHAMSNSHVLGPVCYQPPSLNGNVITWRKKPELTEAGPLHCATVATTAPTDAPTGDRHCASFGYNFRPRKGRRESGTKALYRAKKAQTDCAEVAFHWE